MSPRTCTKHQQDDGLSPPSTKQLNSARAAYVRGSRELHSSLGPLIARARGVRPVVKSTYLEQTALNEF